MEIGNYNGAWDKLFRKSIEVFKRFSQFLLITDGDISIVDSVKDKVNILIQRCLWHIPYQARHVLWQDGVRRKGKEWLHVISELMEICAIRPFVDCQKIIEKMIESKRNRLEAMIQYCLSKGYTHTVSYTANPSLPIYTMEIKDVFSVRFIAFGAKNMLRVRFHGRGGQGAKVASRVLGTAAFIEGCYAQDFPLYGAERRGAPIAAFTRISQEPILERGVISRPDIVIVMDETLLDNPIANPLSGLKEGGIVFINTTHSPAEAKGKFKVTEQVITLDITKIGLDMLGLPVLSTLAGGVATRIAGLKEDSLRRAVEKEASEILTDKALVAKNVEAALCCFHAVHPGEVKTTEAIQKGSTVIAVPFEPAAISSPSINTTANTPLRKTGNWRVFKPVWNYEACTKCMTCVARCPDGCIAVNEDGFPYTDYDNCKGCMICVEECPTKAIEKVRDVPT